MGLNFLEQGLKGLELFIYLSHLSQEINQTLICDRNSPVDLRVSFRILEGFVQVVHFRVLLLSLFQALQDRFSSDHIVWNLDYPLITLLQFAYHEWVVAPGILQLNLLDWIAQRALPLKSFRVFLACFHNNFLECKAQSRFTLNQSERSSIWIYRICCKVCLSVNRHEGMFHEEAVSWETELV